MTTQPPAPTTRISVRGEDFLVREAQPYGTQGHYAIACEGLSEIVRGHDYVFDTQLDDFQILRPEDTALVADTSSGYRLARLYWETQLRNAYATTDKITIADRGAINLAAYQLEPTRKALALPRARILIADGVGLGKTIEVGILLAELAKRGRGKRVLVLALKSILAQFQQELWNRFSIPLVRLDSVGVAKLRTELPTDKNPFDFYEKTIISLDTLKGGQFKYFLEQSYWDVIVIDECHTVANPNSQRGKLAQLLARRCDSLILTSATPHNGRREQFANLMTMLEPTAVPRNLEFDATTISKYFVRRFKHDIEDADVRANFQDREVLRTNTRLGPAEEAFMSWQQALKQREIADAGPGGLHQFFSILLFKAYLSSPAAAQETLERKMAKLPLPDQQGAGPQVPGQDEGAAVEEQPLTEYETLREGLDLVTTVQQLRQDSKLTALITLLRDINWKGKPSDERIVIFAERIATLRYLYTELKSAFKLKDAAVANFHGSLTDVEQQAMIEDFGTANSSVRLFLTSDAGAQGVNLHYFCHRMVNYDLPWSLITLDQRNGRIDRYGQKQPPKIHYLITTSEAENVEGDLRILERIREKEEEVKNTLGTVGTVLQLFSAEKEEAHTARAIATGNADFLDGAAPAPAADDPDAADRDLEAFLTLAAAPPEQADPLGALLAGHTSFYADDFDYYEQLLRYLLEEGSIKAGEVTIRSEDRLLEVSTNEEMQYLLEGMPREAKPARGKLFQLSPDRDTVMKAIEAARSDQDSWTQFQLLYDLHPLAKFWMTKLEARIEKASAPIIRVPGLRDGHYAYLFHGQLTNRLGRNVLSEFFVLQTDATGRMSARPLPLADFLEQQQLLDQLTTLPVTEKDIAAARELLPDVIRMADEFYMRSKQAELSAKMRRQSQRYQEELNAWARQSDAELDLDHVGMLVEDVDRSILDEHSRFQADLTTLAGGAYLRVLGVVVG